MHQSRDDANVRCAANVAGVSIASSRRRGRRRARGPSVPRRRHEAGEQERASCATCTIETARGCVELSGFGAKSQYACDTSRCTTRSCSVYRRVLAQERSIARGTARSPTCTRCEWPSRRRAAVRDRPLPALGESRRRQLIAITAMMSSDGETTRGRRARRARGRGDVAAIRSGDIAATVLEQPSRTSGGQASRWAPPRDRRARADAKASREARVEECPRDAGRLRELLDERIAPRRSRLFVGDATSVVARVRRSDERRTACGWRRQISSATCPNDRGRPHGGRRTGSSTRVRVVGELRDADPISCGAGCRRARVPHEMTGSSRAKCGVKNIQCAR